MDDAKFTEIIERLKDAVDIVSVIEETGAEFEMSRTRRGKYHYGVQHDSLAVDVQWGRYTWFSKPGEGGHQYETGDVFDWLRRHRGMEFREAVEYLAEKAGIQLPPDMWGGEGQQNPARAAAVRKKYDLLAIAQEWFEKQLWETSAALEYATQTRGWDEKTLRRITLASDGKTVIATGAGVGFSGGAAAAAKKLAGELDLYGFDKKTPLAVSLIGLQGGVKAWCKAHDIEPQENWLKHDRIYGLVDFPRLIYPHFWRGRVEFFSGRNLKWEDGKLVGEDGKMKAYNPPRALVGERKRYYNWHFRRHGGHVWVVEGQADAIALGEWGEPAVALLGLGVDESLAQMLKDISVIYLALDADKRGQDAILRAASMLGPMTRIVDWTGA